ncbi:MAG: pilus assembly protein [Roseinatronobacter sp.]|nr:MAG: pilus assembly protein [Roseinatronobacter sp.]
MTTLMLFLLVTFAVGGVLYALFQPQLQRQDICNRRRAAILSTGAGLPAAPGKSSLDEVLRELETKQKAKQGARPSLRERLRQAGLRWTKARYYGICAAVGAVCAVLIFALWQNVALAVVPAVILGFTLPHFYVNHRRNKRLSAFTEVFPDALDIVIRGVKSGLPLGDCLRIIAAESQEPVKSEFKKLVEDHTFGMTNEEAVHRLFQRMPLPETSFFSIVITIQGRTGGNLSEALGNLSKVLRERKKMREKIKAMSSEAKASASIIAALPFLVSIFVYLTSPEYISLLFTTTLGNATLVGCALWMFTGVMVMKKMINFDM